MYERFGDEGLGDERQGTTDIEPRCSHAKGVLSGKALVVGERGRHPS